MSTSVVLIAVLAALSFGLIACGRQERIAKPLGLGAYGLTIRGPGVTYTARVTVTGQDGEPINQAQTRELGALADALGASNGVRLIGQVTRERGDGELVVTADFNGIPQASYTLTRAGETVVITLGD